MPKICAFPQKLQTMANVAGARVKRTMDGRWSVEAKGMGGQLVRRAFNTEDEVRGVLSKILNKNVPELDANFPFAIRGEVSRISAPRIGDEPIPMTGVRKAVGGLGTGVLKWYTPIKQISQFVEAQGQGQAFTNVWRVLEDSTREVHRFFASEKRARLGNVSFDEAIIDLNRQAAGLGKEQAELSVLVSESLTKQELRQPGALLANGIDDDHVRMADFISGLGIAEDMPRLLRANVLIDDFLKNRSDTINETIPMLRRLISEGQIPQDFTAVVDRISAMTGNEDSIAKVMHAMNIPENEVAGMILLRGLMGMRIDDPNLARYIAGVRINPQPFAYNIPALFRYAVAPELKPGFKNGWDQFAAERGMTEQAKSVAKRRWQILEDAFADSGYDPKQILAGSLPIFRQFIDVGMFPGRQFGGSARGAINSYARMLVEDLPEAAEVLTRRVLSGHINPYELHPSVTANKHVRNLLMRKHLDPKLPDVKKEIKKIESINPEMGRVFGDHFNEVIGLPSDQFKRLTEAFRTTARYLGKNMDDQFAERLVHTMSRMVSQAAIPLRPALILRNYISQSLFTASFVGPEAWWHGLKVAMGWAGEGTFKARNLREAIAEAIKAGAIDPNVLPIHAHSQIMGLDSARFKNVPLQQLQAYADQLFDMGFTWYRSGDDFGRTLSFFAGKHRVNKHVGDYVAGKISLEEFKRRAKVKIYHEVIEKNFDDMILAGQYDDAANMIGKELAEKTHFVYGNGNHPVGWNGPIGRLFGQFGTFPTQYLQAVTEGVTRGTLKDRVEFVASHSAFNMGVVAAGLSIDADLSSWAMLPSLGYTGGPYADAFIHLAVLASGNDAEQALARRSLGFMFPSAENPQSIFVPGSYFVADWVKAFREDDPLTIALRASGVRTLGPGDKRPESALMDGLAWIDEIGPGR